MIYRYIRKILKGASMTSALFVFQACYGTPSDIRFDDYQVRVSVLSAGDMSPLEGIAIKTKVYSDDSIEWTHSGYTDADGAAEVTVPNLGGNNPLFRFESVDGAYMVKDTVIADPGMPVNIKLQETR